MNTTPTKETKTTIGDNDYCTKNSVEWQNLLSLKGLNPNVRNIQCNLSDDDDDDEDDGGYIHELSIDWSSYDLHDEYNPGGEPDEEVQQDIAKYLPKLHVIWDLQRITSLHISNYPFKTLPGGIGNLCTTLEHLEIKNCSELIEIPSEIGRLSKLKTLRISQCYKLISLPSEIGELHQLIQLESDANHELQFVPPDIGRLSNLKVLKISHASDSLTLPTEIGRLQRLEVLILSILSGVQTLPIANDDDDDDDGNEEDDIDTDTEDDGSSDGSTSSTSSNLLPSLQHLQMFGCGGSDGEPLNVENLEKMDLQNIKSIRLSRIDSLPLALKEKTPSLESLHLTGVPHDALINFFATEWPEDNSNIDTLVFTGIRTGRNGGAAAGNKSNDWTLRDAYSQILPGLPSSLSRLDLANQGIDSLDGFLIHPANRTDIVDGDKQQQQLPKGLKTLFLDGNPILKSASEKDRSNLHKLLLANPQLGCIGWDRHLHHLHPENKASKFFDPRYQLFTPTTTHLLLLNRCGRSLLCRDDDHRCDGTKKSSDEDDDLTNTKNNNSVPLGIWPHVLARVRNAVWNNDGNGNSGVVADRSMEHSVIFSLLQGPALLDRPRC